MKICLLSSLCSSAVPLSRVYSPSSESSSSKGKQQMMFNSQIYQAVSLIPNCKKEPLDIDSELQDLSFIHCYCRSEFMLCIAIMIVSPSTYTGGETVIPKTEHKETHGINPSPASVVCSRGWLSMSSVVPWSSFFPFKSPKQAT